MSRALQALVGLASVAQPTAVTATQQTNSNQNIATEYEQPSIATNFVTTTLLGLDLGIGAAVSSNPYALIGLASVSDEEANQTRFYIDYIIRPALWFDMENGGANSLRKSEVLIKAPTVGGVSQITSASPLSNAEVRPSRMSNINAQIPGGITFPQVVANYDHVAATLDNDLYTFRFGLPHGFIDVRNIITNGISVLVPYNADNTFAITFRDTFLPNGEEGYRLLQYETTFYYNPTLGIMFDSLDSFGNPVTGSIHRDIKPQVIPAD